MHVVYSTVFGPGDQTGSSKSRAAPPEPYGNPGVEAAHKEERQEIEEDEIHHVQNILVVLLDIGYADDVDVAVVETIADGLDVEKSGRGVHGRQDPYDTYHHPEASPGQHGSALDRMDDSQVTLGAHHHEDQYAGGVRERVHEHVHLAEEITQLPAVHQVVGECLVDAEYAHAKVRYRQVCQEEICDAAQPTGERHHENHHQVA